MFGNVKKSPYSYRYDDSDVKLSEDMLKYWSNFIKTGNPNGTGLTNWSEWDNTNKVFELGKNEGIFEDKYVELYKIFDEFLGV